VQGMRAVSVVVAVGIVAEAVSVVAVGIVAEAVSVVAVAEEIVVVWFVAYSVAAV